MIRQVILGVVLKRAVADKHGVSHTWLSSVVNSTAGRDYARHLLDLTERYTAALGALGMVPDDIIRPR